ncbi:MAG: helix-turn-helix transcriptional regulator [Oscillospiraceae bacterium]|nr:helix-turn-helix transcriptional regulator [Oscillospiraceae bacterium]
MDAVKTGRFIAEARKQKGLTQARLAEELGISDKTVSKWESGRGLPEVSLMLPLCERLGISVNDLLSGERVSQAEYKNKAEENMIDLIKENEENKKKFTLSMITGSVTIVAVVALTLLAAYLEVPAVVRVLFIALAAVCAFFGIYEAAMLEREAGAFECPSCGELFVPSMKDYTKGYHTFTKRRLTCPKCGNTGMCRHRITR